MLQILALAVKVARNEQDLWPEFARYTDEFNMAFWPSVLDTGRVAWWNAARTSNIAVVPA